MIPSPPVSVIVVSHGRPALLRRVLVGIGQLFYRPFELVVVADRAGLAAIADLPFADRIKSAPQESPNISVARNQGAAMAGGDILAFIDDDAVPEPTWLTHLVSPVLETDCAAVTGTVLGRNGISVQWANRMVDAEGLARPAPSGSLPQGHAVKLEGTNMAIRRDVLSDLGGFDEGFRFYLDETDLAFRLMMSGERAAYAPSATVHHGYAESARRRADRVPLSLEEIGQSTALYLRKHAPSDCLDDALAALRREQSARIATLRRAGRISQQHATQLLAGLDRGIDRGLAHTSSGPRPLPAPPPFQPLLDAPPRPSVVLSGRWFNRKALFRRAAAHVAEDQPVSLFVLDHTVRAHRVTFTDDGIWVQSGGLFGPSLRDQPRFTTWSFHGRISAEVQRLENLRWISRRDGGHRVVDEMHR